MTSLLDTCRWFPAGIHELDNNRSLYINAFELLHVITRGVVSSAAGTALAAPIICQSTNKHWPKVNKTQQNQLQTLSANFESNKKHEDNSNRS